VFLPPLFGNQVPPCDPFPFVNASLAPPTECAARQHRPPHTRYACSLWFVPHGRCLVGTHRPHPHLLETGAIWGSAPARLTVWSPHLFYLAQTLPLGPPHVWRLSGVSGFGCNMFVFSRLGRVFFSERRNGPFPTQAHVSVAADGPAYDPQDAQEVQSTTCLPSWCLRGLMSLHCLTERHCPAVCPGLGRRQSWRGGTHHAVWLGVSYRVLVLLF